MSNFLSGLFGYSIAALVGAAAFLGQAARDGGDPSLVAATRSLAGPLSEIVTADGIDASAEAADPRAEELRAAEARFVERVAEDLKIAVNIVPAVARSSETASVADVSSSADPSLDGMPEARVTAEAVNLRSGPSRNFSPVGKAVQDEVVRLTGSTDGDWVEIEVPGQGLTAWMHRRYLERL